MISHHEPPLISYHQARYDDKSFQLHDCSSNVLIKCAHPERADGQIHSRQKLLFEPLGALQYSSDRKAQTTLVKNIIFVSRRWIPHKNQD